MDPPLNEELIEVVDTFLVANEHLILAPYRVVGNKVYIYMNPCS